MIVCVCNNVNVNTIKSSIDSGAESIEAIRETTGAGACCGKCQFKVNRVLHQHGGFSPSIDSVPQKANFG